MIIRHIFILCIFLPSLAVYVHEFSNHEHEYCQESTIHLHEYEEVCCLDNFVSNKIYSLYINSNKSLVFLFNSEISGIEVLNQKSFLLNFFKRGPPSN